MKLTVSLLVSLAVVSMNVANSQDQSSDPFAWPETCDDSMKSAKSPGAAAGIAKDNCDALCADPADTTGMTPLKGDALTTCVKEKCASDTVLCNFLASSNGKTCCDAFKADTAKFGGYASLCSTCKVPANTPEVISCWDAMLDARADKDAAAAMAAEGWKIQTPGDAVCKAMFKTAKGNACCRFAGANKGYPKGATEGEGMNLFTTACKACGVSTEGGVSVTVDKASAGAKNEAGAAASTSLAAGVAALAALPLMF